MSRKVTYGDIPRQRTKYLLNALLKFANYEVDNCENLAIGCEGAEGSRAPN